MIRSEPIRFKTVGLVGKDGKIYPPESKEFKDFEMRLYWWKLVGQDPDMYVPQDSR